MYFQSYSPCVQLARYVQKIIVQEATESSTYKVLPDTGLVIGFQYRGRLFHEARGGSQSLSISGISGLADHYKVFKTSSVIGTVLVMFKEAGAAPFFKQPLHELFRESLSLDNFMLRSELIVLEEQLIEATGDCARVEIVERFLISRMTRLEADKLVMACLAMIHKASGNIRISTLSDHLHLSQSALERRFRKVVGASPKKFASIVRFKNMLQQQVSGNSLTALGYDAGFFDQAHFIKEFKTFTGETPQFFIKQK